MIKIKSITIEKLRGIKHLSYAFDNENLVIHGPNGSGKSGVIDAIEFALTGNINRLTGPGTAGITISEHAPHVDYRDDSKEAKTVLEVVNQSTGHVFIIERDVFASKKPRITPNNKEGQAILNFLADHSEFSLSRRDILKLIVTAPNQRAKEVQLLLKLDILEKIRSSLSKLNNEIKRTSKERAQRCELAKNELCNHFEILEIKKDDLLAQANAKREILGLSAITEFTSETKFAVGLDTENLTNKRVIQKKDSCNRLVNLLKKLEDQDLDTESSILALSFLQNQPELIKQITKQDFYECGLELIIDNLCPLCDTDYELDALKQHIQEKIKTNDKAISLRRDIEVGCLKIKNEYEALLLEVNEINRDIVALELTDEKAIIVTLLNDIRSHSKLLDAPFDNLAIIETIFKEPYFLFDNPIRELFQKTLNIIEKIPDYSIEEKAKQFLIIADERISFYKQARKNKITYDDRSEKTERLLHLFIEINEKKLTNLYESVEKDFARFYSIINNDDEKEFGAQLEHSNGSLNLSVDFYGRGVFPPNAFHSEGHQDSMGLCLYLALSKKIMGDNFTFCLLDDVLMSVDANHRREICALLKTEFSKTQLIITTHDEVWKKQLITEGIVKSKKVIQFRGWTVENGPAYLCEKETMLEIENLIAAGNISEAAPALRRYLEFILTELSFKFRVKLEINYVGSYELGDLSDAVIHQYKDYLQKAKNIARSWKKNDIEEQINQINDRLTAAVENTQIERWSLNPAVHYNEWANFTVHDFMPVKNAFFNLLNQFKCLTCQTWLYASPKKGAIESVRCDCGSIFINLKKNSN